METDKTGQWLLQARRWARAAPQVYPRKTIPAPLCWYFSLFLPPCPCLCHLPQKMQLKHPGKYEPREEKGGRTRVKMQCLLPSDQEVAPLFSESLAFPFRATRGLPPPLCHCPHIPLPTTTHPPPASPTRLKILSQQVISEIRCSDLVKLSPWKSTDINTSLHRAFGILGLETQRRQWCNAPLSYRGCSRFSFMLWFMISVHKLGSCWNNDPLKDGSFLLCLHYVNSQVKKIEMKKLLLFLGRVLM